jgi:signal transduction histidine kinase
VARPRPLAVRFFECARKGHLAAIPLPWKDTPLGVIVGLLPLDTRLSPTVYTRWHQVASEAALALRYAEAIRGAQHAGTDHERLRLKEELHDTVSQRLFGLSMLTARAEADARSTGHPELSAQLTELRTLVAEASSDIRLLMGDPPETVASDRLSARLSVLATNFGAPNNLAIGLELAEDWDDLSEDCTADVTRVVRECLRNVVKHARATEVSIRIPAQADGTLLIEVADNGAGFDPRAVGRASFGLGLINERARDRGGSCEVDVGDEGTTMRVRLTPEYESDWQLARRALDARTRQWRTTSAE